MIGLSLGLGITSCGGGVGGVTGVQFIVAGSVQSTGLIPPAGYAVGDFILLGAMQTTDATIPTVPGGSDWLTPVADATHVISVQGAAAAGMMAYKIADDLAEAGGGFLGAAAVTESIYRGASPSSPILYCNMLAGTTSPVSYPALNGGLAFSEPCWVVLMNRTQNVVTVPTPSGFTVRIDASRRMILDSAGNLNSFAQSDQVVTTPGKWITMSVAIKKASL